MESASIDGLGVRTISPLEIGTLRDISYTNFVIAATVSEPSPIYLMIRALGLRLRARNRTD
ncbi:hypothetical protein Nwat_1103 [Nitrosococcus watsonii C-113]|uniref:Uncharacterized protein n=1 Tax=Nitrosococcus watsoni (strain C-113) TaxID=105559 RepID=D8K560_NITWC|nr:hypothetical protein Nwat_1103 [Nitrosococcus watsonii C-113]